MKPLIIVVLLILAVAIALSGVNGIMERLREPTYAEVIADYARADAIQRQNELDAQYAPLRAAFLALVVAAATLGAMAYLASLAAIHVRNVSVYARPDSAGLLPVARLDQETARAALLDGYHVARIEQARNPGVPAQLHYAPSYEPRITGVPQAALPGDVAPALPALPGLTDLADLAFQPSVDRILLGLGPGGAPLTVPMRSLWHVALAGPTGNGKSNIARMVVAQLQAINAKVCIGDPKWTEYDAEQDEDWRPIARRLAREPAYDAKGIGALLRWAADPKTGELERRLELRRRGERVGAALFLYLDELPWIAKHVPDAELMIGDLVRVGRGVGLFLLVGAQDMLAKTINLSAERENFKTGFYLGGDDKTGSVLLGIPQREVSDPDGVGLAWLRSSATTPPQQVRVPYASNRAVYKLLGDGSADLVDFAPASRPTSSATSEAASLRTREVGAEVGREAPASGVRTLTPRDRQILALVAQQKGITEIVAEVWGVRGGSKFGEYSSEVMRIVAQNLRGDL